MTNTFWLGWLLFVLLFLVIPMGYGWGYRGRGLPYPRYVQQRRASRTLPSDTAAAAKCRAWGWGGDFVWAMILIAGGWAVGGILLR